MKNSSQEPRAKSQEPRAKSQEPRAKSQEPKPFVKWAGGKRQILDILHEAKPKSFNKYFEPFIGGGAFFFSLKPNNAVISDLNPELVNCYKIIRDNLDALITALKTHKNEPDYFYSIRSQNPENIGDVERASRFIFLNKTCFNGLYRENSKGEFNTPFGRYKNPKILDETNLRLIGSYLAEVSVDIYCASYDIICDKASKGDFVYLDPPYVPLTSTASFSSYTRSGFGLKEQERLADKFAELAKKGIYVMLSNSNTEIVHELYKGFKIQKVCATRAINCKAAARGKAANEVLITSY